eukprot:1140430-Pelagomonas_calceolata.AAC.2
MHAWAWAVGNANAKMQQINSNFKDSDNASSSKGHRDGEGGSHEGVLKLSTSGSMDKVWKLLKPSCYRYNTECGSSAMTLTWMRKLQHKQATRVESIVYT